MTTLSHVVLYYPLLSATPPRVHLWLPVCLQYTSFPCIVGSQRNGVCVFVAFYLVPEGGLSQYWRSRWMHRSGVRLWFQAEILHVVGKAVPKYRVQVLESTQSTWWCPRGCSKWFDDLNIVPQLQRQAVACERKWGRFGRQPLLSKKPLPWKHAFLWTIRFSLNYKINTLVGTWHK